MDDRILRLSSVIASLRVWTGATSSESNPGTTAIRFSPSRGKILLRVSMLHCNLAQRNPAIVSTASHASTLVSCFIAEVLEQTLTSSMIPPNCAPSRHLSMN